MAVAVVKKENSNNIYLTQEIMKKNIGAPTTENFWRYKRPVAQLKHEGRGGASKTIVSNLKEIGAALRVEAAVIMKFLAYNLATSSSSVSLKGHHETARVEQEIEQFIEEYVLCPECKYPEISLSVCGGKLMYSCAACGSARALKTTHKLKQYYLKNPPRKITQSVSAPQLAVPRAPAKVFVPPTSAVNWHVETTPDAIVARREVFGNAKFFE